MEKFVPRRPTREEMTQVADLLNGEGMNTHVEILYDMYDLQPDASKVVVDTLGLVLSHCCFVTLDEKNTIINSFVTRKEHRGRGLGKLVWDACEKANEGKNHFMNGRVLLVPKYEKKGFKLTPSFTLFQVFVPLRKQFVQPPEKEHEKPCKVKIYHSELFKDVDRYDATFHPIKRTHFLRVHLSKCHNVRVAYKGKEVCGYGCLRESFQGFCLQPLYADDKSIAECLLKSLVANIPDGTLLKMTISGENPDTLDVLKLMGYVHKPVPPEHFTRRMFTVVDSPVTSIHRVFSTSNTQYTVI